MKADRISADSYIKEQRLWYKEISELLMTLSYDCEMTAIKKLSIIMHETNMLENQRNYIQMMNSPLNIGKFFYLSFSVQYWVLTMEMSPSELVKISKKK